MEPWHTKRISTLPDEIALDGSDVRVLLRLQGGSMAHFELAPNQTSFAVTLRTVEEIWYFLSGRGEMWRKRGDCKEVVAVGPGICLTLPQGTHFQFRSFGPEPLAAIGVTMPPWPGKGEAIQVAGLWTPTIDRSSRPLAGQRSAGPGP